MTLQAVAAAIEPTPLPTLSEWALIARGSCGVEGVMRRAWRQAH